PCANSIWMATARPTSPCTAEKTKPSTAIPSRITTTGNESCPAGNFRWECSEKTSPPDGLLEESVHIGDRFSVGSAEVIVTQPRMPCYKLGVRFQSDDIVKRFLASARTGFYLAVTREGEVGAGDEIARISQDRGAVSVAEITRLYIAKRYSDEDTDSVHRALQISALPESWKHYFRDRLQRRYVYLCISYC